MIEMYFVVQGRFTKYPGKQAVLNKLNSGKEVRLGVDVDRDDNQIVLIDLDTGSTAGCIPRNPVYINEYINLRKITDSGFSQFVDVRAVKVCPGNTHYQVAMTFKGAETMLEMSVYCDFCGNRIPGDANDNVTLHKTKEIDTSKLFPHLCENCATKLDKTMLLCKKRWIDEGDAVAQIAERNAARRELLGTKG